MGSRCVVGINRANISEGCQGRKERLRTDVCLERAQLCPDEGSVYGPT